MKNTKIEWADHTVNLWWGCSEVSEACKNCYARNLAARFKRDCFGKFAERWLRLGKAFGEIVSLNASAQKRGVCETVFINSMSDFFDERVALEFRLEAWRRFADAPNLVFLILTKRAVVLKNHLNLWSGKIPPNVHFGITAENQARLDERMAALSEFKGKLFLSCEPLLGRLDITPYLSRVDWVICGGETGAHARECDMENCAHLFHQTRDMKALNNCDIPFFFKKRGDNPKDFPDWKMIMEGIREFPTWHSSREEQK